ncbi:type I polyketide synthase, partial [Streptomyces sp. NPDC056004]|uniref:type I polyketide synthase n=1 Tax=Streptomyces sp. NPDC056004 TaxID=3345677 RepID=UPI0035D7188F
SRLSLDSHPWLADHAIFGSVLLPGTAFVELALHAGERIGCGVLDELTIQAPLVFPEHGAVVLQVVVGAAETDNRRSVTIHSSTETNAWTLHATGSLSTEPATTATPLTEWPPRDAVLVETDGLYENMAAAGFGYGPVFQGLRTVWQRDNEIYAEVALDQDLWDEANRFGLHPALLDATLHAIAATGGPTGLDGPGLPFAWTGVTLTAIGSPVLRVRITHHQNATITLDLADGTGTPVGHIDALTLRPVTAEQIDGATPHTHTDSLFQLEWVPAPAVPDTAPAREFEVLEIPGPDAGVDQITDVHTRVTDTLTRLQAWLDEDHPDTTHLIVLTHGATNADNTPITDLTAATTWGLIRSAQAEHPDRITLIDTPTNTPTPDHHTLTTLTTLTTLNEPQIALTTNNTPHIPRLTQTPTPTSTPTEPTPLNTNGTILITGANGALGTLIARHLVQTHGAHNLVLAARRPNGGPNGPQLITELNNLGATARWATCDTTDRNALTTLINEITQNDHLTGIIHTAGTLDDATLQTLTPQKLTTVLRPKVDAAWHLHQLTTHLDLSFFVLFSS